MRLIRALAREREMAVMCIMHDLHVAHAFADRMILMEQGVIADWGAPNQVCTGAAMRRLTGMKIELQENGGLSTRILRDEEEI